MSVVVYLTIFLITAEHNKNQKQDSHNSPNRPPNNGAGVE